MRKMYSCSLVNLSGLKQGKILDGIESNSRPTSQSGIPARIEGVGKMGDRESPSRNPILVRDQKAKALLAKAAAAGAVKRAAAQAGASSVRQTMLSPSAGGLAEGYYAEGEEALERGGGDGPTTLSARFVAVDGGRRVAIQSIPNTRPYFPHRREGGIPANEQEAGNLAVALRRLVGWLVGWLAGEQSDEDNRNP